MGTIVPAETHKGKFAYVENQSVKSLFTATQTRVDDEAHQNRQPPAISGSAQHSHEHGRLLDSETSISTLFRPTCL